MLLAHGCRNRSQSCHGLACLCDNDFRARARHFIHQSGQVGYCLRPFTWSRGIRSIDDCGSRRQRHGADVVVASIGCSIHGSVGAGLSIVSHVEHYKRFALRHQYVERYRCHWKPVTVFPSADKSISTLAKVGATPGRPNERSKSISVILRAMCVIHRLSGWGVMPAMWTEREAMSLKKKRGL